MPLGPLITASATQNSAAALCHFLVEVALPVTVPALLAPVVSDLAPVVSDRFLPGYRA